MIDVTVKSLAAEINTSVKRLIQKLSDAGIKKTEFDIVTQKEKEALLVYLNRNKTLSDKLTLQRKMRSVLNIAGTGGKNKLVQIEIRKKHTYTKDNVDDIQKDKVFKKTISAFKNHIYKKETRKENIFKTNIVFSKVKNQININTLEKKIMYRHNLLNNNEDLNKIKREVKAEELKRKTEETAYRKLEEEAKRIAAEAKKMAEENNNWNELFHEKEDVFDYHTTTSQHARRAEDENDQKVENDHRHRVIKTVRQKKTLKHEEKNDREELRSITRKQKSKRKIKNLHQNFKKPLQIINRSVILRESIKISDLANKIAVKSSEMLKLISNMGITATANQKIDQETAQIIIEEMGHKAILKYDNALEKSIMKDRDIDRNMQLRAPIVTIMGHVDHGKTSLLDKIRSTKIALTETGGITQHIGAYHVKTQHGSITFLDTPGHTAFTAMRARGAKVTDIVVLVIAADDGIMPQTIEAIQHAKAAKVPIIVALNKIDKVEESNIDQIKNALTKYDILPEEWGGENIFVNISAKTGLGIDTLLHAISLQAEILELKTSHKGMACGTVIESSLDKGRGPVASILIQSGILKKGDIILCGFEYGRIRAIKNDLGQNISQAGPSIPVEIIGLSGVPLVADKATAVRDEKKARAVALYRKEKYREYKFSNQNTTNVENLFEKIQEKKNYDINVIIKADVQGSVEAICNTLIEYSKDKLKVKIIGSGVGGITETDAVLSSASNAIIIGFNVRVTSTAKKIIEKENLDFRSYNIIYNLFDDIKKIMHGLETPKYNKKMLGKAEIRNIFSSNKFGIIAGCMIVEGKIKRNNLMRILRKNTVLYEGEIHSLRRFKEDVSEVRSGMECGIGINHYNNINTGDIIEVFQNVKI